MTDELPPLPEPNQACRYLCATCGFYGASGSASHPNDEGASCGHFPQVLGPWFTADQMHAYARSARATLERDAARLDWLIDNCTHFPLSHMIDGRLNVAENSRAAIDLAITQDAP